MKQLIASTLLCFALITLGSFNNLKNCQNADFESRAPMASGKKIVYISFTFSQGLCSYTVSAFINTTSANGFGSLSESCGGRPPRTITFAITHAQITLLNGQITVVSSDLADFLDVATNTDPELSASTKQAIATGITANGTFE
jgi:hypothetical protein